MPSNKDKLYSVITGDIIKSSRLPASKMKRLMNILRNSSKEIRTAFPNTIMSNIDTFRGDGWQVLIKKPELSLRVALYYRAYIKSSMRIDKINTRMAISLGTVKSLPNRSGSDGIGEAYTLSGKASDEMGKTRLLFVSNILPDNQNINLIFGFVDYLSAKWTSRQSSILMLALRGFTQTEIAKKLSIAQQTVSGQLDASGWYVIEKGLISYEGILKAYCR